MLAPAVRILIGEKLLDVTNGENEVCLTEHSHSWDEPSHDPSPCLTCITCNESGVEIIQQLTSELHKQLFLSTQTVLPVIHQELLGIFCCTVQHKHANFVDLSSKIKHGYALEFVGCDSDQSFAGRALHE